MKGYTDCKSSILLQNPITQTAAMPYALYLSLQGKYFVGYADNMEFGNGTTAWAGLINPIYSDVNLHVYVWTVTNIGESPILADIWFNANLTGDPMKSEFVTPANTAICPLLAPNVRLLQANNVTEEFRCGDKISTNKVLPEVTIASEEVGKFIFPPGGSFIISLSNPEVSDKISQGRVAFGWWEEEIKNCNK